MRSKMKLDLCFVSPKFSGLCYYSVGHCGAYGFVSQTADSWTHAANA